MKTRSVLLSLSLTALAFAPRLRAQTTTDGTFDSADAGSSQDASTSQAGSPTADQQGGFIHDWLSMVTDTQNEQPHWSLTIERFNPTRK